MNLFDDLVSTEEARSGAEVAPVRVSRGIAWAFFCASLVLTAALLCAFAAGMLWRASSAENGLSRKDRRRMVISVFVGLVVAGIPAALLVFAIYAFAQAGLYAALPLEGVDRSVIREWEGLYAVIGPTLPAYWPAAVSTLIAHARLLTLRQIDAPEQPLLLLLKLFGTVAAVFSVAILLPVADWPGVGRLGREAELVLCACVMLAAYLPVDELLLRWMRAKRMVNF